MSLDPLESTFCQYAAANWESGDWELFGLETETSEILNADPRLYRSLTFGDDDYLEAICRVAPKALETARNGKDSPKERIELLYDYAPDLLTWAFGNMKNRMLRRLLTHLCMNVLSVPKRWQEQVSIAVASDSNIAGLIQEVRTEIEPELKAKNPFSFFSLEGAYFSGDKIKSETTLSAAGEINAGEDKHMHDSKSDTKESSKGKQIFLVHGRDIPSVREIQLFTWHITGIMPTSLADAPGQGSTIIEKFEREADKVVYAIVLLTPDDEGRLKPLPGATAVAPQDRARQNVVLELGYFFGKLGRHRVAVLNAGVEEPSDVHGLQYIAFPGHDWKEGLRQELSAVGLLK